jgi:hypothetical protein
MSRTRLRTWHAKPHIEEFCFDAGVTFLKTHMDSNSQQCYELSKAVASIAIAGYHQHENQ